MVVHTAVDKNLTQPSLVQFSTGCGPNSAPLLQQEPNAGLFLLLSNLRYQTRTKKLCGFFWVGKLEEINWITYIMSSCVSPCIEIVTVDFFKRIEKPLGSWLLSYVAHSCNIKTLIKSPINMLVPFCLTPADDEKETTFSFFLQSLFF